MPKLLRYDSNATIPPPFEAQIRSLVNAEWLGAEDGEDIRPLTEPELHPVYFALADGDQVLSYARTIWMLVSHLEQNLKLYGLGDVITKPVFRHKGYGGRVVEEATAYIKSDREADAALLLTEPNLEVFYRRSGWCHLTKPIRMTGESDPSAAGALFPMVLLLSAKAHALLGGSHKKPLVLSGDEW